LKKLHAPRLPFALALALAVALAGPPSALSAQENPVEAARAYRQANEVGILEFYRDLLSRPNYGGDLERITALAEFIAAEFRLRGASMELLTLPDAPPLITGEIRVPGAVRTIGIYVHYDGQPTTGPDWVHGPFEPVLYSDRMDLGGEPIAMPAAGEAVDPNWRIYARSASDDKAPLPALLAALDALRQADIPLTSNIRLLFDGEEELGSPNLDEYIDAYPDRFDVDLWLFCDGPVHQTGAPQVVFGVRGVTGLGVTVYGPARPLHSGHYGNWAPVPGQMLAELIASMKDDDGNVVIDGFYDTVEPLGRTEREALQRLPLPDEQLRADLGLGWTEGDGTLAERLMLPSLTVRGMVSGSVGANARNVIPDRAEAALGIRLVKGNDPEAMVDLVEAHIRAQGYHVVYEEPDMEMRRLHPRIARVDRRESGYPASRTDMTLPRVEEVIAAVQQATSENVLLVPALGGSLPLYLFTEKLARPAVILPIANHDNNQHASNENIRIGNLWYGIDLYASLLTMR
jgi:acetylornithine deacetylase/succinyl-diaminopimelate desuccinylase-like protein